MKLVQSYSTRVNLKRLIGFIIEYSGNWFTVFKFEIEPSYNRYAPDKATPIPRRTTWSAFSEIA